MCTDLTLVMPCYNEERRLNIKKIESFLKDNKNINILFVNDGSRDKTLDILDSLKNAVPAQVNVLDLTQNVGKANAVRLGVLEAIEQKNSEFIGFWDADLSTPLDEVLRFLAHFKSNKKLDIICGCRLQRLGVKVYRTATRHYIGRVFATIFSFILGLPVYDTQCGAKIFRATSAVDIFAMPFQCKWLFDVEILGRYRDIVGNKLCREKILELTLTQWQEVSGSKISIKDAPLIIADTIRLFFYFKFKTK